MRFPVLRHNDALSAIPPQIVKERSQP
jgi:hypothetical protein